MSAWLAASKQPTAILHTVLAFPHAANMQAYVADAIHTFHLGCKFCDQTRVPRAFFGTAGTVHQALSPQHCTLQLTSSHSLLLGSDRLHHPNPPHRTKAWAGSVMSEVPSNTGCGRNAFSTSPCQYSLSFVLRYQSMVLRSPSSQVVVSSQPRAASLSQPMK